MTPLELGRPDDSGCEWRHRSTIFSIPKSAEAVEQFVSARERQIDVQQWLL